MGDVYFFFGLYDKMNKVFREIKFVGDMIIFGDLNIWGLERKKLVMGIGFFSGVILDLVIVCFENDFIFSEVVYCVIYYVGINNISIDFIEEIKVKLDILKNKIIEKYLSVIVGFCEILINY